MKILLLNPPSFASCQYLREGICQGQLTTAGWPPVTLATIGALLRTIPGAIVRLVDASIMCFSVSQLKAVIKDLSPDIIIMSTTTPSFVSDMRAAEVVRDVVPNAKLVLFGTHVSVLAEKVLRETDVDVIVRNEPERTMFELVRAMTEKKTLSGVKGITYRDSEKIVANENAPFIVDLDSVPFPDRTLMDTAVYINPVSGKKFTIIRNSRGCPGRCTFCVGFYYGKEWRTRSVENILAELQECVERFKITDFLFSSDLFTLKKDQVIALCQGIIQRGLHITWMCNSRVDCIDEERLFWMKKAGCYMVSLGIESGVQDILDAVHKGTSVEKVRTAVSLFRKYKIQTIGYFIFGLPGDTVGTMKKTISFSVQLPLTFAAFLNAVPYPGTEFSVLLKESGAIRSEDWSRYQETGCDVYALPWVTPRQLRRYTVLAYLCWYLRPGQMFALFLRYCSPQGLRTLGRLFLFFCRMQARRLLS